MSEDDLAHVFKALGEVRQLVEASHEAAESERGAMLKILTDVQAASERREASGARISKAEFWKTVVGSVVSEVMKAVLTAAAGKWLLLHLSAALGWVHAFAADVIKQLGD